MAAAAVGTSLAVRFRHAPVARPLGAMTPTAATIPS